MKNKEELEKEFNNKLDQLRNEFNQQIKELECKPKFEVGKWYKNKENFALFNYNGADLSQSGFVGYGLNNSGWLNSGFYLYPNDHHLYFPATDKEVEDALVKEAVKRGVKEGVKCKSVNGDCEFILNGSSVKYYSDDNSFYMGNYRVVTFYR